MENGELEAAFPLPLFLLFSLRQENNLMVEPTFFSAALIKSGKFSV
jgi:hypothetical protein